MKYASGEARGVDASILEAVLSIDNWISIGGGGVFTVCSAESAIGYFIGHLISWHPLIEHSLWLHAYYLWG